MAQYGVIKINGEPQRVTVLQVYPDGDMRVQLHDNVDGGISGLHFAVGTNLVVKSQDFTEVAASQLYSAKAPA